MTFVDSNILIDVFSDDPRWYDWSVTQLAKASLTGTVFINDVVYAETSARFANIGKLEEALAGAGVVRTPIPSEALFLAGKAYVRYRQTGGLRTGVLPDFFIGAHAAVERLPLLTRDVGRYRTYFPTVELIAP